MPFGMIEESFHVFVWRKRREREREAIFEPLLLRFCFCFSGVVKTETPNWAEHRTPCLYGQYLSFFFFNFMYLPVWLSISFPFPYYPHFRSPWKVKTKVYCTACNNWGSLYQESDCIYVTASLFQRLFFLLFFQISKYFCSNCDRRIMDTFYRVLALIHQNTLNHCQPVRLSREYCWQTSPRNIFQLCVCFFFFFFYCCLSIDSVFKYC